MKQNLQNVKRRRTYYPSDWERHRRVIDAMHAKKITLTELARQIGINQGYLSSLSWGTQRSPLWETKIALALGRTREELFRSTAEAVA